jgi:hypothetical protein
MRLFILLTLCLPLFVNAQEICNNNLDDDGDGLVDCLDGDCSSKPCEICDNGIDDDGDAFIDCYDKECTRNIACSGFFLRASDCDAAPESVLPFQMKLKFTSGTEQTNHLARIIAGDIDGDGTTELVTTYTQGVAGALSKKINILNAPTFGTTLDLTRSIDVNVGTGNADLYDDIATADINGDGCAEIFAVSADGATYRIVAYDCNGNQVWANPISLAFHPGLIGLTDFDHDGLVELYSRTQVFDAHTGTLLGNNNIDNTNTGIHNGVNKGWGMNSNAPVAADILPGNPGLELVAGCRIYGVNINRSTMTATLPLLTEYPQYATRTGRGTSSPTSVADFNQDGSLDILAVGSEGAYDANTTIFFWDVAHNIVKKYVDLSGSGNYLNGWRNGAGRINIADIDGDTLMNAVYVSGKYLYALREGATNLELLWRQNIVEETSGFTACTMFDFNGDGRTEIIYRDEDYLYTFATDQNGVVTTGPPIRCNSRSHHEYPIVTDMDGDGSAEICITCSTDNTTAGRNLDFWSQAEIRVYESANEPWMPARKVWNQHGYFVTNVNDDLTIPREQQLHHLIYAKNAPCRNNGTSRPLNSFMNQIGFLNSSGCPSFPAANLSFVPVSPGRLIGYTPFTCLDESVQVTFKYANRGEVPMNGTLRISFYDGDPRLQGAIKLSTESVEVVGMNPGDTLTTIADLQIPASTLDLYIVLNDDGTTIPLDIASQPGHLTECNYDNLINVYLQPSELPLVPELSRDNLKCLTVPGVPVTPDNGAVKAYTILSGGVKDSTNFNFYWSNGTIAKPIATADYIGQNYTALGAGAYTVYAVHKTIECVSDTATIVVNETISGIDAMIVLENEFDNEENPNGELRVVVNDTDHDGVGDPANNFNYTWYEGLDFSVGNPLGTHYTLTGLDAGTYSVLVSDKATGCYDSAYATIALKEIILSADEDAGTLGVSMYPNPGKDGLTVVIDNGYVGEVQLQMLSALGNEVENSVSIHKGTRSLEVLVETATLKPGVYLVKVSLGNGSLLKKWVKF